jgi:hypothetical protein
MSTATEGVHMQYSSPPHQHEPGLSWAGEPPCHVRSFPTMHPDLDDEEVINETFVGSIFTKIPNTTNMATIPIIINIELALPQHV